MGGLGAGVTSRQRTVPADPWEVGAVRLTWGGGWYWGLEKLGVTRGRADLTPEPPALLRAQP